MRLELMIFGDEEFKAEIRRELDRDQGKMHNLPLYPKQ